MDPEETPPPRKMRFLPKRQIRRINKANAVPKSEDVDDDVDKEAREQLLKRFAQPRRRQRPQVEDKSTVQVQPAFTLEAKPSATTRASNRLGDGGLKQGYESALMQLYDSIEVPSISSSSAAGPIVTREASGLDLGRKKAYKEPWNYDSDYPITLPWRRPYSGNPDILDEAEFGESARAVEYDETKFNPACELGFLNPDETNDNGRLLFIQLPKTLPAVKRSATAKGKEVVEGSSPPSDQKGPTSIRAGFSHRSCSLEDLSAGKMGKLLVYKSGAVKLKLGETLYDVSPGSDCTFAQEVVAVNVKKQESCAIGSLDKRAIVTPDIDYLLDSVVNLD